MATRRRGSRPRTTPRQRAPLTIMAVVGGIFAWLAAAVYLPIPEPDASSSAGYSPPVSQSGMGPTPSRPGTVIATNAPPVSTPAPAPVQQIYGQKVTAFWNARCVGVSDGDTLTALTPDQVQVKIRLTGIDAPESRQAFGSVAKQALSERCFGKTITVYQVGVDRYQRILAFVAADNYLINAELVRRGFAWHYRQYSKSAELQQLEDMARAYRVGLWVDSNPIYPEEFRKLR